MVTLLGPNQNKTSTAGVKPASTPSALVNYDEASATRPAEEIADPQPRTEVESISGASRENFWASVASSLAGLRALLAGPPMTEQDRRRQTLAEAKIKDAASLNWFYGMPF